MEDILNEFTHSDEVYNKGLEKQKERDEKHKVFYEKFSKSLKFAYETLIWDLRMALCMTRIWDLPMALSMTSMDIYNTIKNTLHSVICFFF